MTATWVPLGPSRGHRGPILDRLHLGSSPCSTPATATSTASEDSRSSSSSQRTRDCRCAGAALSGVTLFFVLSGYLITSLLIREWDRWGSISLWRFWGRRAVRLLPALLLLIALDSPAAVGHG